MGAAAVLQQSQCAVKFGVCILRQRQHDVPANIGETGLLRPCQRPGGPGSRVGAAQPLQLCVIGALHAEADAVHPGLPKANQCFGCHHIGVGLQRDLSAGQGVSSLYQGADLPRGKQRRGAAAKVQGVGPTGAFGKLPQQGVYIRLRHAARPRC